MFIHVDPQFDQLLRITAQRRKAALAMVEKDYWVTHCLWSLHAQGFEVWFKGGTSLSKYFGLIERFSEDLDLKLEPGTLSTLLERGELLGFEQLERDELLEGALVAQRVVQVQRSDFVGRRAAPHADQGEMLL
jgi:Nucleotidyl transferase AbiEii toxin, Type IV TA system